MVGASSTPWKAGKKKPSEKEWEELGRKVEHKVIREVKSWADEVGSEESDATIDGDGEVGPGMRSERDKEWSEIGRLVEEKIKRKVRKWAEEE